MTADELQRLARMLGNSTWCRYWMHYNYPQAEPWEMALSCVEFQMQRNARISLPCPVDGLKERGFRTELVDGLIYYIIARTNEDGTPFRSEGP